tara:strand:- start:184 stop:528 length:345 start_codon:yes stop_codon:yes gene_type:complete
MKTLIINVLSFLIIFNALSSKVHSIENESLVDKTQIIITNKYAENFCNAKADHYFDGLDNEKALKYSYFKYIGFQNKEMYSKDIYPNLINQIRAKCFITNEEEREINELFTQKP